MNCPESDNWVDTKSLSPLKLPVIEGNFPTTVREYNADQNGFAQFNGILGKLPGLERAYLQVLVDGEEQANVVDKLELSPQLVQLLQGRQEQVSDRVTPVIEQQSLGTRVVSVEHIQFMRSRNIELKVQKLKPRTKFYGFFDGIKIPQN